MRAPFRSVLILAGVVSLATSCSSNRVQDGDAVDAALTAATQQALTTEDTTFTDAKFKSGAGCPDCRVLHWARLNLPETAVVAASAKLLSPAGVFHEVTITDSGTRSDARALLAAERGAKRSKYGKKRVELATWLSTAKDTDRRWIWVWTDAKVDTPRREDLLADEVVRTTHEKKVRAAVDAALEEVTKWTEKNAPDAKLGDRAGPGVYIELTAKQIRAIESLPAILEVGTDEYPGVPLGEPWSAESQWGATLRVPEAHAVTTGTGARVCIKESTRPDDLTFLPGLWMANSGGTASPHARVTTALVWSSEASGTQKLSVAPGATVAVANNSTAPNQWCIDNSARTISYSQLVNSSSSGALTLMDMQHDWLAKNSPFILVVAAAGNRNSIYDPARVGNRGYNGLVVGYGLDANTAHRGDDTWSLFSAHLNPTASYTDHELPHVIAPGQARVGGGSGPAALTGTSPAAAMVAGVAALVESRDPSFFGGWPEAKRSVILATATGRADQGLITSLTNPGGDAKIGAGIVDALQAVNLASSANVATSTPAAMGRTAFTLSWSGSFGTDQYLTTKWKAKAPQNGRMRVAIAWDATATCASGPDSSCTADVNDADLDLHLFRNATAPTPSPDCASSTYGSAWELCDVPVAANEELLIGVKKYGTAGTGTYFSVAWYFCAPGKAWVRGMS